MTFNIANCARFRSPMLVAAAIAAVTPAGALGAIGLAIAGKKKTPKVVDCPISDLNGASEMPTLLPAWDDTSAEDLYWEGYNSGEGTYCMHIDEWGRNAGREQATLLMLAIGEVFGVTGDSGFGLCESRTFHRPLPLESTAIRAARTEKKLGKKVWRETCNWIMREYGVTQKTLRNMRNDTMYLYRGVSASIVESTLIKGLPMPCRIAESWTLDYDTAKHFATRKSSEGYVLTCEIPVRDIVLCHEKHCCLNSNEEEFLVVSGGQLLWEDLVYCEHIGPDEEYDNWMADTFEPEDNKLEPVDPVSCTTCNAGDFCECDYDPFGLAEMKNSNVKTTDLFNLLADEEIEDEHDGDAFDGMGIITPAEIARRKAAAKFHDHNLPRYEDRKYMVCAHVNISEEVAHWYHDNVPF